VISERRKGRGKGRRREEGWWVLIKSNNYPSVTLSILVRGNLKSTARTSCVPDVLRLFALRLCLDDDELINSHDHDHALLSLAVTASPQLLTAE
jgi:hypothetical protein